MSAVKLTKNELKKEKDSLKTFLRYLPTLQLKKQQLQMVMRQLEKETRELEQEKAGIVQDASSWIGVFAQGTKIADFLSIQEIVTTRGSIAGLEIPVFERLVFREIPHDLFLTPLWTDAGMVFMKRLLTLDARLKVFARQLELVGHELRITSQRVNLFEKIKIPETRENIRRIQIFLGDQQTAAVVRGKIAKNKLLGRQAS